jgi:hypothetical protein
MQELSCRILYIADSLLLTWHSWLFLKIKKTDSEIITPSGNFEINFSENGTSFKSILTPYSQKLCPNLEPCFLGRLFIRCYLFVLTVRRSISKTLVYLQFRGYFKTIFISILEIIFSSNAKWCQHCCAEQQ